MSDQEDGERAAAARAYTHPALFRRDPQRVAELEVRLTQALAEQEDASVLTLTSLDLFSVPPAVFGRTSLLRLSLNRNCLVQLPPELSALKALQVLDLSRNRLQVLPEAIGELCSLCELDVMTNHLRPLERSVPLAALAKLTSLRRLDVRFNPKLTSATLAEALAAHLPAGCALSLGDGPRPPRETCGERDAGLLRSQLEPWSTPALRRRLAAEFGTDTDPEETGRDGVMQMLLQAYDAAGGRAVRPVAGVPPPQASGHLLAELLELLRGTDWPRGADRERQSISAQGYIILNRSGSKRVQSAAAKLLKHKAVWDLAYELIRSVDVEFAEQYTAIAMTKQFAGSPHVDTENVGPFYGLALGDFQGGCVCVESSPWEVVEMDTHNKFGKVDGRFPHWVSSHTGERYSIIYYQTAGTTVPKTTAVFS